MRAHGWRSSERGASRGLFVWNFRPLLSFACLSASSSFQNSSLAGASPGSHALGATRPDARLCLSELLAHGSQLYPQADSSSKRHPQISCRPHDPRSRPHPS